MKLKFRFNKTEIIKYIAFILFGLSIASIPIFSFNAKLRLIPWVIMGVMFIDILIFLVLKKRVSIDVVVLALIAFSLSAIISSALNGFHGFNMTPVILPIATLAIYIFSKESSSSKQMLFSAYLGVCVFLISFIFVYRNEIVHFDFSERLGGYFGDENDIAILLGFGFAYSFYSCLNSKIVYRIIIFVVLSVLFAFCGLQTGSRIILLIFATVIVLSIILKFGKKHWWISCLIIFGIIVLGAILISLPIFEVIRKRLLIFFETFFANTSSRADYSSIFRIYMFEDGIQMFLRKPLFGFGIWGFATYGGLNNGWSHNHVSEGLCNFGLVGFVLFHIPLISSLINYRYTKDKKNGRLSLIMICFFIVSMISVSFFTEKIYAFASAPIFAAFTQKEVKTLYFFTKQKGELHENS